MTQTKRHFREIDVLKGVAIAMVLLGHSIIEFPIDLSLIFWCKYLHVFVSSAHMPLFFAISGFCFSFHGWKEYLGKKCRRILVPFLVFSLLSILMKLLFPSVVNGTAALGRSLLAVLTGGAHWFLYTLFIIFLFFPLIQQYFENDRPGLFLIAVIGLLQLFAFWPTIFNVDRIVKFSFFFFCGYYLKCLWKRAPERTRKLLDLVKRPLIIVLCLLVWALLTYVRVLLDKEAGPDAQEVEKGLFSMDALAALGAALAGVPAIVGLTLHCVSRRSSRLFETAGRDSLQLYLFNGYLLTVTRWLVVTKLHIRTPALVIGANFFVMFFISLAMIELIVRRVKLFRSLTGIV